jgi:hypothetical protein
VDSSGPKPSELPAWAVPGEEWLSAPELAGQLGRGRRAVELWFKHNKCAFIIVRRPDGKGGSMREVRVSQLSVARAAMKAMGLDAAAPMPGTGGAAGGGAGGKGDERGGGPPDPVTLFDEGVAARVNELVRDELQKRGDVPFDEMLARARTEWGKMMENKPASNAGAGEIDRYMSAMQKCGREIRALEEARFEIEERNGEWIQRETASRMLQDLAETFNVALQAMLANITQQAGLAMSPYIRPEDLEASRRILAATLRTCVDSARATVANHIVQQTQGHSQAHGDSQGKAA